MKRAKTPKMTEKLRIKEVVIVEGRDDTAAVKRACECGTIETHGYGISGKTWEKIARAAGSCGLIVLTDPDHAGENIRKRVMERFPEAKQAYIPRTKAAKDGDIGVENAAPEAIAEALKKAHATVVSSADAPVFTMDDMLSARLAFGEGCGERRGKLCDILGIGRGNVKATLGKLNSFGISRKEFDEALRAADDQIHQE